MTDSGDRAHSSRPMFGRPHLALLLLAVVAPFCGGCLQENERITLNPDGSGEFSYELTYDPLALDRAAEATGRKPEELRRALPDLESMLFAMINGARGVDVWSEARIEADSTGRQRILLGGYFKDISEFEIGDPATAMGAGADKAQKNPSPFNRLTFEPGPSGTRVLSYSMGESESTEVRSDTSAEHDLTDEERTKLDEARAVFLVGTNMMATLLRDARIRSEIEVPGTVVDAGFFEPVGDSAVRLSFSIPKLALALSELVQDDRVARRLLGDQIGTSTTMMSAFAAAMADSELGARFTRKLFGRPGGPKITFRPGGPRFDYAARRNYAADHPPPGLEATQARARSAAEFVRTGEPVELPACNFGLTIPPGWTRYDATLPLPPQGVLGFRRGVKLFGFVLQETLQVPVALDDLEKMVRINLRGTGDVKGQIDERRSMNGFEFAHLTTRMRQISGKEMYFEHWITSRAGFCWQILLGSSLADSADVQEASRAVAESFHVLDSTVTVGVEVGARDAERPEWGFRLVGVAKGWQEAWDPGSLLDLCELFWTHAEEAIAIVPARWDDAPGDLQAAAHALLETMGFRYPAETGFQRRSWSPPLGEGIELLTEQVIEGSLYRYILRVVAIREAAWLIAGWYAKGDGGEERVRRALDAVELEPPRGPPPDPPTRSVAMASFYNAMGMSFFVRESYEDAARCFQAAFGRAGTEPIFLANVVEALKSAGRADEARTYLERYREAFPLNPGLWLSRGKLQLDAGEADSANASVLESLRLGLDDEDELQLWLQAMVAEERSDLAVLISEAWVAKHPTLTARLWNARTLRENGDLDRAATLLQTLAAEYPDDSSVATDLAATLNIADRPVEAAEVAQRFMDRHGPSADLLASVGWSQMARKWYREAKATFEKAATLAPGDEEIAEGIRHASAMLGQGSNSEIKRPIEPVPMPTALERALGSAEPPPSGEGFPAVVLRELTGYAVEPGAPVRTTRRARVRVLNQEGAASYSTLEFEFHPDAQRAYINRIEVRDASGAVIATASSDDAYVIDKPSDAASNTKMLHAQVRGVAPGNVLEWEVTFEGLSEKDGLEFERHVLAGWVPTAVSAAYVVGDTSAVAAVVRNGADVSIVTGDRLKAWIVHPRRVEQPEPNMMRIEDRLPMVSLCGREGTWQDVGREYLTDIADLLEPSSEVARLAATITTGAIDERQRIAALARYVQRELHYKAIEFGRRARRPDAPQKVLAQRYGDCKDHALLLHLLLSAADISSSLAMVNTNWRIEPTLPSLDQFDHMVVLVPGLSDGWLVDATDKYIPLDRLPNSDLAHTHALVLDPEEAYLLSPPDSLHPDSYDLSIRRNAVAHDADWDVVETLKLRGYVAASFRKWLVGVDPVERARRMQGFLDPTGTVQVSNVHLDGLEDVAADVTAELSYTVRNALSVNGAHATGIAPAPIERIYLSLPFVRDRQSPFEFRWPLHLTSDVTLRLAGHAADSLVTPHRQHTGTYCDWTLDTAISGDGGDLTLHLDFRANPGRHAADEYGAMLEAWQSALREVRRPLAW